MHAFDVLGDPVRRRILEVLADGEAAAGAVTEVIQGELGLSQPAVSQHLKVLRDAGFVAVRAEGTRRIYALEEGPIDALSAWVDGLRRQWEHRLDALATEVARGRRERRSGA